uniref:BLUF domain-containing protein n=1 Tax=Marinobacterium profundum TaxID=1714300 RepID=UPI000837A811|nr:BLUF domain-containing protein [Marinobacterium profundum]
MNETYHLIYASEAVRDFSQEEMFELLSKAREFNHKLNVSGMLLYDRGSFFQILEGEKTQIQELFSKISKDKRHRNIVRIIFEAIPEKDFADWSMGYAPLSKSELNQIEGMNDFFEGQSCLHNIDAGRSLKLLKAFTKGRWRLS